MPRADGKQEIWKAGWERCGLVVRWPVPLQGAVRLVL